MSLTVEQMSRLTSYAAAGETLERFLSASEIPDEDKDEAQEYWNDMQSAIKNMQPWEQLSVPSDWV